MNNMPTVSPYLTINGAKEAIAYYEEVLKAKLLHQLPAEDGERLMHATLEINGSIVMLSDQFPEYGNYLGPDHERGSPVAISLRYNEPSQVDKVYALALEKGGKESSPPEDMFWGDRFAQFIDPSGHRWMLAAKL